jgi:hypothetical protein
LSQKVTQSQREKDFCGAKVLFLSEPAVAARMSPSDQQIESRIPDIPDVERVGGA